MPKGNKAAKAGGSEQLDFTLSLPHGANTNTLLVMGGADADRDGTVEDNGEYAVFDRANNVWTLSQQVPAPATGMIFFVQANIGADVAFEFEITDSAGATRYSKTGISVNPVLTIRWVLS